MQEQTTLEQLEQLLHYKKSKKFYAEKLNITEEEVAALLLEIRTSSKKQQEDAETAAYIAALEEKVIEENLEKGTYKSTINTDFEPKSVEDLYALHKIDKTKYKITNYWSKLKSNGKFTSSVFATAKKDADYSQEDFSKFLETYKAPVKITEFSTQNPTKEFVDVEISIADFHLAKKTLENESIAEKKEQYITILTGLIQKATGAFNIKKAVFIISNDFFHTDNYQNQTTNGTPQDVLTGYDNEYEQGFDLLVTAITFLKYFAQEVEVVLVQGNHDRTKSFYVAHALEVYFKNTKTISFQRHHSTTKHVVLGNTFIGYHHGNCKIDDLPLLFATGTTSKDFGNATYREVHTGDKHHYMAKEIKGVRVQQMPSLSGTDRWHSDNNYVNNIRAAILNVYHPAKGRCAEYEERL
jgi:hypothetical protein